MSEPGKQPRRRRLPPQRFYVSTVPAIAAPPLTPEQIRRGYDVLFGSTNNAPLFISNAPTPSLATT